MSEPPRAASDSAYTDRPERKRCQPFTISPFFQFLYLPASLPEAQPRTVLGTSRALCEQLTAPPGREGLISPPRPCGPALCSRFPGRTDQPAGRRSRRRLADACLFNVSRSGRVGAACCAGAVSGQPRSDPLSMRPPSRRKERIELRRSVALDVLAC